MSIPPVKALLFMKHHSERVPLKNIRNFCGKPLFYWIVETLQRSPYITEIIVNTDSEEIAKLARPLGVTIHMRPDELLTITSNEANLIMEHDLSITEGDYFLQSHSTNPLVRVATINRAVETFFGQTECDSLMGVTEVRKRFFWPDGRPINHDINKLIKTQELTPLLEENSCVYMFSRQSFQDSKNRVGKKPLLFPIDAVESTDIDEEEDFLIAESIMEYLIRHNKR